MSGLGLILGTVAFLVMRFGDAFDRLGRTGTGLAVVSPAPGIVALLLAETAAAEVLLAVFMASILVVGAVELMDHAGLLPCAGDPTGLTHA